MGEALRTHRRNKYGARRTEFDGHTFDSKTECEYYRYLIGKYPKDDIIVHPPSVVLLPTMSWKLDFYIKSEDRYIDVKGFSTREFKEKAKVWKALGPTVLTVVHKVPIIIWSEENYGPGEYEVVKKS